MQAVRIEQQQGKETEREQVHAKEQQRESGREWEWEQEPQNERTWDGQMLAAWIERDLAPAE